MAQGSSIFVENIFESRYKHVPELIRMGADIKVEGRVALVHGVKELHSATVHCTDLRGGAAIAVAALAAAGETELLDSGRAAKSAGRPLSGRPREVKIRSRAAVRQDLQASAVDTRYTGIRPAGDYDTRRTS